MIYEAINNVMDEIGVVGKGKKSQQGYMYRGIDAVMNALSPALIKHKVFVVPEVLEQTREERQTSKGGLLIYSICKVKYTFYDATDGSHVEAVVIGEGMDSGDKATNKAMSIAFKYACFQVFCIPTEEMVDPDAECHDVAPKKPQNNGVEAPKESNGGKKASEKQIEYIKQIVKDIDGMLKYYKIDKIEDLTVAQASAIIAAKGGNK